MTRYEMAEELRTIKGYCEGTSDVGIAMVFRLAEVVEALVTETTEEAS